MAHKGFYFTDDQNRTIELPVAPAEFTIPSELDNTTETVLKLGEVNRQGDRKLYALTLNGTFPEDPKRTHYTTAQNLLNGGGDYIAFFERWQQRKRPGRFVITGTGVNIPVTIEAIHYGMADGNDREFVYSLDIKEWRNFAAKKTVIKVAKVPRRPEPRPAPAGKVGIGSRVIVNGQLHRDSYGSGPGQTERNAERLINFTAPGRAFPYHVTTLQGGWRGWVSAGAVRPA